MQGLEVFFLIGAIIFLGFFASVFFDRTKISDILILMFIGMLVGTFMRGQYGEVIQIFENAAPIVGTVALIVILFDGGINLNVFRAVSELSATTMFTLVNFFLTVVLVGVFMTAFFGLDLLPGLLFGVVVGGVGARCGLFGVGEPVAVRIVVGGVVGVALAGVDLTVVIGVLDAVAVEAS